MDVFFLFVNMFVFHAPYGNQQISLMRLAWLNKVCMYVYVCMYGKCSDRSEVIPSAAPSCLSSDWDESRAG